MSTRGTAKFVVFSFMAVATLSLCTALFFLLAPLFCREGVAYAASSYTHDKVTLSGGRMSRRIYGGIETVYTVRIFDSNNKPVAIVDSGVNPGYEGSPVVYFPIWPRIHMAPKNFSYGKFGAFALCFFGVSAFFYWSAHKARRID